MTYALSEIHFEISSVCNASCSYCTWALKPSYGNLMDFDLICRLLGEAKEMGVTRLNFHGVGEPTLHPRLLDILGKAEELGFMNYILSTNCSLLNGPLAEGLRQMEGLGLILAVPWVMGEKFVNTCVANAAAYLGKPNQNRQVTAQMVCDEKAHPYYRRFVNEFLPLVERAANAVMYLKQPLTWPNDSPNVGFIYEELGGHPQVNLERFRTPVSIGAYCNMPEFFMLINANGVCIPCCVGMHDWGLGTVHGGSLFEIWHSSEMHRIREMWRTMDDSIPCGHCLKRRDCRTDRHS